MFPYVMLAADVVEEVPVSQTAWVLEVGGLIFLFCAVLSIVLGIVQGGDEHTGGGRLVGYGVAMAAVSGIALYAAGQMGGDPLLALQGVKWMYPLVAVIGCLLYASHTLNRAKHRSVRKGHMSERESHSRRGYESLSRADSNSDRRLLRARR